MDDLMFVLDDKLRQHFAGARPALEWVPSAISDKKDALLWEEPSRVGGFLIWDGFDGISQHERQHHVWKMMRAELTPELLKRVIAVLTLTPLEEQAMLEDE